MRPVLRVVVGGVHLEVLERAFQYQYRHMHGLCQGELLIWFEPFMQYVDNHRSTFTDWSQLPAMIGDYMSEAICRTVLFLW